MKDELPFESDSSQFDEISTGGKGFASVMSDFVKLTEMENKISAAIDNSKVPWIETRKYLKGENVNEIINTPLGQFIQDLFREMGLGDLELTNFDSFEYTFTVKDCPVCKMFKDVVDKKVCNPTVDALYRFFSQNLQIECEVKESKCSNAGGEVCEFKVILQPLQVYKIALDNNDIKILDQIKEVGLEDYKSFIKSLEDKSGLARAEVEFRIQNLQQYEILDNNFNLTPVGETYYTFIQSNPLGDEDSFDPPWKEMSKLTSTIAATRSFAEAFVVVADEEELPWMVDDKEIIDLKDRAKDKSSFAQLLKQELKDDEEEDED
jgi:predicted hydrocarbon binding protein